MGCDKKTVLKYSKLLTSNKSTSSISKMVDNSNIDLYKKIILDNKDNYKSRTELRQNFPKEYIYLYRHDKDWLFANLPKVEERVVIKNTRIDWSVKDIELLHLLEENYNYLINLEPPMRLSVSFIQKTLKINEYYIKNIDKLPKLKKYLNSIYETTEMFQIRRCKKIIDNKLKNDEFIRLWEIQRLAGIRTNAFNKIKNELNNYIETNKYKD